MPERHLSAASKSNLPTRSVSVLISAGVSTPGKPLLRIDDEVGGFAIVGFKQLLQPGQRLLDAGGIARAAGAVAGGVIGKSGAKVRKHRIEGKREGADRLVDTAARS